MDQKIMEQALHALRYRWPSFRPAAALVLGSGWAEVTRAFSIQEEVSYSEVPGLGQTGVAGHAGRLAWAEASGVPTLIFQGRRHWYEGEGWTPVALPIFIMKHLGVRSVLLTNAAGGIARDLHAGSLMSLKDHIHWMGSQPLVGPHDPVWGPRFPDQTAVYDPGLRAALHRASAAAGVQMREGVYLAASGPTYETPAEVNAFERLGADAVGMSTAPEATLAHAAGIRVAAISCISNLACGRSPMPLSHEEVAHAAAEAMPRMRAVIEAYWRELAREQS